MKSSAQKKPRTRAVIAAWAFTLLAQYLALGLFAFVATAHWTIGRFDGSRVEYYTWTSYLVEVTVLGLIPFTISSALLFAARSRIEHKILKLVTTALIVIGACVFPALAWVTSQSSFFGTTWSFSNIVGAFFIPNLHWFVLFELAAIAPIQLCLSKCPKARRSIIQNEVR